MATGTIKFVDKNGRFGVISRDDKQPKTYLYIDTVHKIGIETIRKHQRYEFQAVQSDDGKWVASDPVYLGG